MTAYDALFARIVEQAGIRVILVGDSLGMVVQGKPNTLAVTMDDMLYHAKLVAGVVQRALVDCGYAVYVLSDQHRRGPAQCGPIAASGCRCGEAGGGRRDGGSNQSHDECWDSCHGPPGDDTTISLYVGRIQGPR